MSLSTRSKIDLGFASALLILTTVGVITYGSTADFVQDARDVAQTHQALESLERVLSHLKDVQSAERGFVITGREQYLDPYRAALPLLDAEIRGVRTLLVDRPLQQERLARVDSLVARRVARGERVVAVRRTDGFEPAAALVRDGTGKQLVDEVRVLVRQMIDEEIALLSEHRAEAETSGQRTQLAILLGSLLGFLMVGVARVVIRRDFAERTRVQRALDKERVFLDRLLFNLADGIVACDADGTLTLFNRAAREFHGLPDEDVPAERCAEYYELYQPDGVTPMKPEDAPLFRALHGEHVREVEMVVAPKGAPARRVLASGQALLDTDGTRLGAVVVMHDVTEKRAAAALLRRERDFALQVMTTMGQGLTVTDSAGHLEYVNPAFARMLGYSADELIGKTPFELSPNEDHEVLSRQFDLRLAGAAGSYETRLRRADGSEVFVYVTAVPRSEQEQGNGAIAVVSNLTQRKLMEGALRESEERFRRLSAATVEGIVIHDSGQILDANESAARMFGYGAEELIGLAAIDLVAPESREVFLANMHSEHERAYEGTGLRRDGSTFPVEIQGSAVSYSDRTVRVTTLRDISERKRAEAALQQSEQRYKQLVENASDIIYRADLRGKLTYVNPVAVRMMGYAEDELLGMHYTRLVRPDQQDEAQRFYAAQIVDQRPTTYWEFAAVTREGREIWLGQHVQLVIEAGRVAGLQAVARDITGQREVERIKDEFISVVSHELRTPLTSIRGSLGLLASGRMGELPERGQRLLEIAAQNTDRLVRLINDILDLERLQSGRVALEKQDCDAADLMAQAVEVVRATAEAAGVTLTCQPRSALLRADPDRIVQVLINLLGNAIKFSPPGATVQLDGERRDGEFRFRVRDRGRGIPADKLESIFGRFQQVDSSDSRQKGGTGLGLAICRSIVEQHDGRIWAESVPAEGSTFVFTLPAPRAHTSATDPQQGALRVLVAEDDPDLARVLMETLERHGIEVHHSATGLDTVRLATEICPDLLVLDLILPDGDGFSVVRQLRDHEALRDLSIVVYSARHVEPAERDQLRLGRTEFLTKAWITPDQLEERVLSLLRETRAEESPIPTT